MLIPHPTKTMALCLLLSFAPPPTDFLIANRPSEELLALMLCYIKNVFVCTRYNTICLRGYVLLRSALSLRRVLHHLPQHKVLPLQRVHLSLQLRHLGLHVPPTVLQRRHVPLLALAGLLGGHSVAQEALEALAFLVIFYVVVLCLGDLVRLGLLDPRHRRVVLLVVVVIIVVRVVVVIVLLLLVVALLTPQRLAAGLLLVGQPLLARLAHHRLGGLIFVSLGTRNLLDASELARAAADHVVVHHQQL
mmetsp:Transcript_24902/g.61357  ORF Transcript_24902/g.61357 Transcript_24902/m.61357 type:complete len:248 (-) Transcript_24902:721-1464(-)